MLIVTSEGYLEDWELASQQLWTQIFLLAVSKDVASFSQALRIGILTSIIFGFYFIISNSISLFLVFLNQESYWLLKV